MHIWAEETHIPAKKYVGPTSRYIGSRVRYYTDQKIIAFETYKRRFRSKSSQDEYAEITQPVEYRPDLVSQEVYGTPDFWWAIMEHNNMKDILEFQAGKIIRLPGNVLY